MRKLLFITPILFLMGCQTSYITNDGERLLSNSVVGCAVGQVLFADCGEGAAVAAGSTIISDQKKLPWGLLENRYIKHIRFEKDFRGVWRGRYKSEHSHIV